jgi:hypothetical protein
MVDLTALTEAMHVVPKTEGELRIVFERRSDPDWSDVTVIYGAETKTFPVFQDDCQAAYEYLLSVSGIAS